jgi:hypothetical protein
MRRKLMCLLLVGLVTALIIPIGSAQPKFQAEMSVFGLIKIDSANHEIKGLVIYGQINGETVFLKNIDINYYGANPIFTESKMPLLMHHLYYNPA